MFAQQFRAASAIHAALLRSPIGGRMRKGWAYAAVGYFVGILLYVIAQFLVNALFNLSGARFGNSLVFLFGRYMVVTSPALVGAVNLAVRGYDHAEQSDRRLFAWTISGAALLAPLIVLFMMFGLIGYLIVGGPSGEVFYAVVVQLAGMVIAIVAGVWALSWVGGHASGAVSD